jgi:hypothetical protein
MALGDDRSSMSQALRSLPIRGEQIVENTIECDFFQERN